MEPFKNKINQEVAETIAGRIKKNFKSFDDKGFVANVVKKLDPLELKERSIMIAEELMIFLPDNYEEAVKVLILSLGDQAKDETNIGNNGFQHFPISNFIEKYGVEHFDASIKLIEALTKRFTGEFAIRPFLIKYPKKTLDVMYQWSKSDNLHLKRLASEGTRPYLPWGIKLQQFINDPTPVLPILEQLKNDPSKYVQNSVANNLNSISKDNPDIVIKTLREWKKNPTKTIDWITKHALRTLFKDGNKESLELLGYGEPEVSINKFKLQSKKIKLGQSIDFQFEIASDSKKDQNLMIDHVIHFMKANGKTSAKVFKLTTKKIKASETLVVQKKHPLKPVTTRKYYSGEHAIAIQVNGKILAKENFELTL